MERSVYYQITTMTLREKQSAFAYLVAQLILEAYRRGYEVTLGASYISEPEAERRGFKKSLHTKRLAIDLNLFRDGKYLDKTEDHKPLGLWWEAHSTALYTCTWGGRFRDGNHYSIEHKGVR